MYKDYKPDEPQKEQKPASDSGESSLDKAKMAKEIAIENYERIDREVKSNLLQKGWQSIEEGLKEIEEIKDETEKIKQEIETSKDKRDNLTIELEEKVKEANLHRQATIDLQKRVEARFQTAIEKEKASYEQIKQGEELIQHLKEGIDYFNEYILPVLHEIGEIKESIYVVAEKLQKKQQFRQLHQFISLKTLSIDRLLEKVVNVEIPEVLLPLQKQPDTEPSSGDALKDNFKKVFNLLNDTSNLFALIGLREISQSLSRDINQLDLWFINNYDEKRGDILSWLNDISANCEEILLDASNNSNQYSPSDLESIADNIDGVNKLLASFSTPNKVN